MKKKSTENFKTQKYPMLLIAFCMLLFSFQTQKSQAQCTAGFTAIEDSLNPGTFMFLNNSSTSVGSIISYQWLFTGGGIDSVQNPIYTWPAQGVYDACLTITTDSGCVDSICSQITVGPIAPSIDIYDFSADSSGTIFCTAPASTDFILQGIADGFSVSDSVYVFIVFGDGSDTTFYLSIQQRYFFSAFQHIYINSGTYTPNVIVSLNGVADTLASTPIVVNSNCGPLSGTVYLDNNQDCVYNSGDALLPNISISLEIAGAAVAWTQTDSNGVYSFNVPAGTTYDVVIHLNNWYGGTYTVGCPSSGSITVSSLPSSGNDFYVSCPNGYDMTGSVSMWGIVPGRAGTICIFAYNRYCSTPSGQIKVVLDPMLTAIPDSGSLYTISGDTIIWNYTSSASYWSLCAQVFTATTAIIGDTACVTMIIEPIAGDADPSNNIVTGCAAVRTSYDPNDKAGEPFGQGTNNAILPGTDITYTIRFQNTGTAEAYDIYILDSLDQNLDLNTYEVLASSHAMVPSILQDNVLRFTFSNIMLPDSNSNEAMSHGYVSYRITPRAGTPDGTVINNTAGIYFDYNPAVVTNTTQHTIDYSLGFKQITKQGGILMNPNPSNEKVYINLIKKGDYTIQLVNMLGEVVISSNNNKDKAEINTSKLPAGVYLVRAENSSEVFQSRLIVSH